MKITVAGLQPNSRYALQFRSKNTNETSPWSRTFVVDMTGDTIPPKPPTALNLKVSGESFVASWTPPFQNADNSALTDFSHYKVRLRNTDSDQIVYLDSLTPEYELTYNLNVALFSPVTATLGVQVAAVDATGNESEWTAEAIVQNPPPGPVQNLAAVGVFEGISTTWDAPENLESDFSEYRLFVSSSDSAVFTNTSNPLWRGQATSHVYTTSTMTPMYVYVAAVDKFNSMSTVMSVGPVTPKSSTEVDTDPPGVPTGLDGTITGNTLTVEWDASADPDLSGYQIAYRPVGATVWSNVPATHEDDEIAITPITQFVDYQIRIRSHDTSFNYSSWSSTVTADGAVNTAPATPTGLQMKTAVTSAMVIWDKNEEADLDYYEVQFGDATPENEDPIFNTTSNIMGFSEDVLTDTTYYTRVRAVDRGGLRSSWSSVVTGTVGYIGEDSITPGMIKVEELAADEAFINNLIVTNANILNLGADKIIAGSGIINDLTIKSTLTVGDGESTNAGIQSENFVQNVSGYRLDDFGLQINNGSVSANALSIQYGQNLMPAAYADFEFTPAWYSNNLNTSYMITGISVDSGAKFNRQHLGTIWGTSAADPSIGFGSSGTDYNIPVEAGKTYIVSAYVCVAGSVETTINLRVKWSTSAIITAATLTPTTGSSTWVRMSGAVTAPSGATAAQVTMSSPSRTDQSGFSVDGIQFEEQLTTSTQPSAWKPPSSTSIDGGIIRTGEIRSNQTVTVGFGNFQPAWSIDMEGDMQIGSAHVRGNIVVGQPVDGNNSYIQSHNYVPASGGGNGEGWIIRSDGSADFRNVTVGQNTIGPDAINAAAIWADTAWMNSVHTNLLTVGAITPEMLASTEELAVNPTWSREELRNVAPYTLPTGASFSTTSAYQYLGGTHVLYWSTANNSTSYLRVTQDNSVTPGERIYVQEFIRRINTTNVTTGTAPGVRAVWLNAAGVEISNEIKTIEGYHNSIPGGSPATEYRGYTFEFIAPAGASKFYIQTVGSTVAQVYIVGAVSVKRSLASTTPDGNEVVLSPQGVAVYQSLLVSGTPGVDAIYDRIALTQMNSVYTAYDPLTDQTSTMSGESVTSPVISGEQVLVDGEDILERMNNMPQGLVLYDRATDPGTYSVSEIGYREFSLNAIGGRSYTIFITVDVALSGEGSFFIYLKKTQSTTGEASEPLVSSTEVGRIASWGNTSAVVHGVFHFKPTVSENARWLISTRNGGSRTARANSSSVWIVDNGPFAELEVSGAYSNGGADPSSGNPPVVPPPNPTPPPKKYTETFTFNTTNGTGFRTLNGLGTSVLNWVPTGKMRQGTAGSSNYQGIMLINSADRNKYAGATITNMELYLYNDTDVSGRTLRLGYHRLTSIPGQSVTGITEYSVTAFTNWPANTGRWVKIPQAWWPSFAAASNKSTGFVIGDTNTSGYHLMDFASPGSSNANRRPKLKISYTK